MRKTYIIQSQDQVLKNSIVLSLICLLHLHHSTFIFFLSHNCTLFITGDGFDGDYELEDLSILEKDERNFEDLCGDATFCQEKSVVENENWGLLDGQVLARVFHFLRTDIKSLVYANLTCKHWRSVVKFYKGICRQADLSSVSNCMDSTLHNIMVS